MNVRLMRFAIDDFRKQIGLPAHIPMALKYEK
jgi:hypothetical protein